MSTIIKNKERIQNFKETRYSRYIYQNELDNDCFHHEMADGGFKDDNKDKNKKVISFCTDDEKSLEKYKTIWTNIEDLNQMFYQSMMIDI